ncbi:MAG: type IIA DNA topoisomerase subunit B [Paludibacteraceae bacterium]|nr:type IIA DNA topoisomerase subunit B [Paludibacteraceae bacterium]
MENNQKDINTFSSDSLPINPNNEVEYAEKDIVTLEGLSHVRLRPGMYIGKLGDGSSSDDGIYVLIKEIIDNCIDEFRMGYGNTVEITVNDGYVTVRDYGRGIPLGKMVAAVSIMNTGAKYDTKAFKKSVGLNGVGTKAVNALSSRFVVRSFRDGQVKKAEFAEGKLIKEWDMEKTGERNGTMVEFSPDLNIFRNYHYQLEFVETMLRNYAYLNNGLSLFLNGKKFLSRNGLKDLLTENLSTEPLYDIVHIKGDDIEIAFTHTDQYGEEYYSFVNGQHTTQGGTHQSAYREVLAKAIKEFYNKNQDLSDIRNGLVAAIAINVEEPVFESQTKIKLGSKDMAKDGPTVAKFIGDFVKKEVDNFLHKNQEVVDALLKKIQMSERERKEISGVTTKLARERAKKISLHNRKLRDCRFHFNDPRGKDKLKNESMDQSSIFITEGDSASGSLTKCRNVDTQAVFSLRGKPLNSFGLTKKAIYENEEFNLLQAALNIEDGLDGLRYNKVIIATDADVDGMHIRLLMLTFFLQFFPDLVKKGHVFILQTPLFRVRKSGKKELSDRYCYSEEERLQAIADLQPNPEITRFKGLGEISPEEFKGFIGDQIRLDQVKLTKGDLISNLLEFYMGKNTQYRQDFIIDNLVVEEDML